MHDKRRKLLCQPRKCVREVWHISHNLYTLQGALGKNTVRSNTIGPTMTDVYTFLLLSRTLMITISDTQLRNRSSTAAKSQLPRAAPRGCTFACSCELVQLDPQHFCAYRALSSLRGGVVTFSYDCI